ncbi:MULTISPECIES: heavy metal translocating P-type ATPase [Deinococcus]|uniref:Heavy metal translocating P-type ATPase n=1 Tax=Deinococcus rufus TaxID=2136097 RepID=A0ABV7Z6Y0_9DEIO|nr:heavy metal translocating P-type ATPase [Deinococcus sp. AB2017081]WQE96169.1 heavy metal translocating P-type ATPase [Deinococcus sp. AB2017081]
MADPASVPLTYVVDGMDCASCVRKVEAMVGRLPGAGDVQTSFTQQTLRLALDETRTPREALEGNLRALGYVPTLQVVQTTPPTPRAGDLAAPTVPGRAWYATPAGRLVVLSGALLLAAWVLGFLAPATSTAAYIAATLVGTVPLARRAWASARLGEPFSINTLVTLAAIGAVLIGEAAEGAVVVFLFTVGELLEGVAAGRARAGIHALAALAPRTALLVHGEHTHEVGADTLQVGQTVQVNPGARVPADGRVLSGMSSVDDSPVTGESVPVVKAVGDTVYAGSINADGVLHVQVERTAADNTIARIIHMVEEAEASRAPTARFIDRFSRVYTPGVVLVSALVAVVPPLLLGQPWHEWLYRGLALLLIGCPCALVLSVPAAVTSAVSAGTRRGLLVKGGAALEAVGGVKTVAFDKTGTLTAGHPAVTQVRGLELPESEVLRLAAAVESGSSHPLARAVTDAARAAGLTVPAATDARAVPGRGVTATVEGRPVYVSAPTHAASLVPLTGLDDDITDLEATGHTVVILHDDTRALGLLALRDELRGDAASAVAALRALGIGTVMLTGDNARTAHAVAAPLDIDVRAGLLPEDKLRIIAGLPGPVAMVGDGINDAPALARADVGIAMGGGTNVALETADAALLRSRVQGVVELVGLSRATMGNIRQNIAFALGLKAIFLVTTLLGTTNLWMAILADTGATAIVTANALRLLRWQPRKGA